MDIKIWYTQPRNYNLIVKLLKQLYLLTFACEKNRLCGKIILDENIKINDHLKYYPLLGCIQFQD